jgi:hypothetical protein
VKRCALLFAILVSWPGMLRAQEQDPEALREQYLPEVRSRLERLATWCDEQSLLRDRNRAFEALLRFDPEHRRARQILRYQKRGGAWVQAPGYREPENDPKAPEDQLPGQRADLLGPLQVRITAVAEGLAPDAPDLLREALAGDLIALDPDDVVGHRLLAETKSEGRWVLDETAGTAERRAWLTARAKAARDAAVEPDSSQVTEEERGLGFTFEALQAPRVRVVGNVPREELATLARGVQAAETFFREVFEVPTTLPEDYTVYALAQRPDFQDFLQGHPAFDRATRDFMIGLGSAWIPGRNALVVWKTSEAEFLDKTVRQTLGRLSHTEFGLGTAQGWAWEGIGIHLTWKLLGTRLTWFVKPTDYSRREAGGGSKNLKESDANWLQIGRQDVLPKHGLALPSLLAKDVNEMDDVDLVRAYVLAVYLLDGFPGRVRAMLRAAGAGGNPQQVLGEPLGRRIPATEQRILRWLRENSGLTE